MLRDTAAYPTRRVIRRTGFESSASLNGGIIRVREPARPSV